MDPGFLCHREGCDNFASPPSIVHPPISANAFRTQHKYYALSEHYYGVKHQSHLGTPDPRPGRGQQPLVGRAGQPSLGYCFQHRRSIRFHHQGPHTVSPPECSTHCSISTKPSKTRKTSSGPLGICLQLVVGSKCDDR